MSPPWKKCFNKFASMFKVNFYQSVSFCCYFELNFHAELNSFFIQNQSYISQVLTIYCGTHNQCMCSKILNHGLNHGLLFSLYKFFGWKNILNLLEISGLKSRFLFGLIFWFYLMYMLLTCKKPAHFLPS